MKQLYEKFMLESNKIEGEDRLNPNDVLAVETMLKGELNKGTVLTVHKLLGEYLKKDWTGKWRTCEVRVGSYYPPLAKNVPALMNKYFREVGAMDSFESHNSFVNIHGFQDLNGRVSRLIWLKKAIEKNYDFSIPFLHKYYYQSLAHQNNS